MQSQHLLKEGWVCVPLNAKDLHKDFFRAMTSELPEMTKAWRPEIRRAFCLSGKLAVPSSQHHPLIRKLRCISKKIALPIIKEMLAMAPLLLPGLAREEIGLAATPDAALVRTTGDTQKGIWHRDFTHGAEVDKDLLFGGWINADETDNQYFRCVPRSHLLEDGSALPCKNVPPNGFLKQKEEDGAMTVTVPAGHMLIFFENMLHTVLPTDWKQRKDATTPMMRLFTGFHATDMKKEANYSLYGSALLTAIDEQAVLPIKGGSRMMLAPKHTGTHTQQNRKRASSWIDAVGLHPLAAETMEKFLAGGKERGDGICPSLQTMGLKFPEYTDAEKAPFLLEPLAKRQRRRLWAVPLKKEASFILA